ncbi:MAG: iron-sulfur cluster repair di-iron protein [Balneolaceae bacterium]
MINTEFKNRPVGEIVSENYHAAGVFREFNIDFCCGGHKTLGEVVAKKGIDVSEVEEKLKGLTWGVSSGAENYKDWTPDFLIDYIEQTHHRFVRQKSEEIKAYAAKVARVHGERHPENIEIFKNFSALTVELLNHLEEEENKVFPLIKELYRQSKEGVAVSEKQQDQLREELDAMLSEHEDAGGLMAEIRELSNQFTPPGDACTTYRILYQNLDGFEQDLHKHVHLENNILFKKAENLLKN